MRSISVQNQNIVDISVISDLLEWRLIVHFVRNDPWLYPPKSVTTVGRSLSPILFFISCFYHSHNNALFYICSKFFYIASCFILKRIYFIGQHLVLLFFFWCRQSPYSPARWKYCLVCWHDYTDCLTQNYPYFLAFSLNQLFKHTYNYMYESMCTHCCIIILSLRTNQEVGTVFSITLLIRRN